MTMMERLYEVRDKVEMERGLALTNHDWSCIVRAILQELREPTEEMLSAAYYTECWGREFAPPQAYWRAMLDSILSQ